MWNHGGHGGHKGKAEGQSGDFRVPPCPPWLHLLVAIAVAACGSPPDSRDTAVPADPLMCGVDSRTVLSDSGIGALRIGATADQVKAQCTVLSDTTLEQGAEGMPQRLMTVVTGSVNTVAEIEGGAVWRIRISSPRYRTADSLGVGSTVAQLRAPGAKLALGEGQFILRPDHCGKSFKIAGPLGRAMTLDAVSDSLRVESVLIFGCPDQP